MAPEQDTIERKLEYLRKLASIKGIYLSMLKWGATLESIHLNIGASIAYRMLMDMYLHLNFNLDPSGWLWHNLDFTKMFTPNFPPHPYTPTLGTMTSPEIENICWHLSHVISTKEKYLWAQTDEAVKIRIRWIREMMIGRGMDPDVVNGIFALLAVIEGKVRITTYVGLAVVGLSEVMPTHFDVRSPQDWKTPISCEAVSLYENHVGFVRVGWCRVTVPYGSPEIMATEELCDHFTNSVEDFRKRTGMVAGSPEETLYQRVFMLQREQKYHWEGGRHQLILQTIINAVKRVLDREGIIVQFRMMYISFAQEIYYLKYDTHRLWKRWKKILTESEVVDKYVRSGCDRDLLERILAIVT